MKAIMQLRFLGLRTVEWTGGGEPTMYPYINESIKNAYGSGLRQGFITNGTVLDRLTGDSLDKLSWMRISMNCLDYVDKINIPTIKGVLGFSYVWNEKTSIDVLERLFDHVKRFQPAYVRVVPNCQATDEEQEKNNRELSETIGAWGFPYFYQAKTFARPEHCWWGYFKPFILHDGWVYPCSSIVLNQGADRKFHEKYRWIRIEKLSEVYFKEARPLPTIECDHCVFKKQNDMVGGLVDRNGMEDFI
jgi:MoaA/NifB/PqqE/SkfB family radical SAM enzyme